MPQGEYAAAGVDYTKIEPFKRAMQDVGRRTLKFPQSRSVFVSQGEHGTVFEYVGLRKHSWCQVTEGLGNKNWIAEWMYQFAGTGLTYYDGIGICAALMAVNDLTAQGAMPVLYTDEVAAGDSDWFKDEKRATALGEGFFRICEEVGMALPAGESPALRYLVKAEPPVRSAPSLSGCALGIIMHSSTNTGTGRRLSAGDVILGVPSSGIHANGISLVIKRAMELQDKFLTRIPNGNMLGEEALIPTRSYVGLVEALVNGGIPVKMFLPGTGGGVAKIAFRKEPRFTYRIHSWVPEIPPLFLYMRELGVSIEDCLTTFNWGVGYYVVVAPDWSETAINVGREVGYEVFEAGVVEQGDRKVIFEPEGITLPPPGE